MRHAKLLLFFWLKAVVSFLWEKRCKCLRPPSLRDERAPVALGDHPAFAQQCDPPSVRVLRRLAFDLNSERLLRFAYMCMSRHVHLTNG